MVWAAGVDLGGTKIQVIQVFADGSLGELVRLPTDVQGGPRAVEGQIAAAVKELGEKAGSAPIGIGVGVAGQVEKHSGVVAFAPNLKWHHEPLQEKLAAASGLPVVVVNDVRAATWGEWLHGAGLGADDLLCVFVGTGIGGGIVSGGHLLEGYNNTAGEIGHVIIQLDGPECTCGSRGCAEAIAGGWGIARRARDAVAADGRAGIAILELADGDPQKITGVIVDKAAEMGDPLALRLQAGTAYALGALTAGLVNTFSPRRIIFGGGVIEGQPEMIASIEHHVRRLALKAATANIEIVRAKLHNNAGSVGAGALAIRRFVSARQLR